MKQFTDLLDEYLEAKAVYDEAKKAAGPEFSYYSSNIIYRKNAARDALNEAFDQIKKEST